MIGANRMAPVPLSVLPLEGLPHLSAALGVTPRAVHSGTFEWFEGGDVRRNFTQLFREVVADVPAGEPVPELDRSKRLAATRLAQRLDLCVAYGEAHRSGGGHQSMAGVKSLTGDYFTPALHQPRLLVLRPLVLVDREYTDFVGERRRSVEFIVELSLEVTRKDPPV